MAEATSKPSGVAVGVAIQRARGRSPPYRIDRRGGRVVSRGCVVERFDERLATSQGESRAGRVWDRPQASLMATRVAHVHAPKPCEPRALARITGGAPCMQAAYVHSTTWRTRTSKGHLSLIMMRFLGPDRIGSASFGDRPECLTAIGWRSER